MELRGIHHITSITADARANLEFYTQALGLRFIKKTVNFDDPSAYHLYYGDQVGTPGSVLTFFEYRGIGYGRAGHGMVHRIVWRVADESAIDFWQRRLSRLGLPLERSAGSLRFNDPEGLNLELVTNSSDEPPLVATSPDIPPGAALQGFDGVRAYHAEPELSAPILREMTFEEAGETGSGAGAAVWRLSGGGRSSRLAYDPAPYLRPVQGAGTVHHVAWVTPGVQQPSWRDRLAAGGLHPTQIIDRIYFRSVYFREPSGVLFELATPGPGFAVDEPLERLGERLQLPPRYESLRRRLEQELTPLTVPGRAA